MGQLFHLLYRYKSMFGLVRSPIVYSSSSSSLFCVQHQQSKQQIFFGQTTELSQGTSTVALDVLAPALRGVENN